MDTFGGYLFDCDHKEVIVNIISNLLQNNSDVTLELIDSELNKNDYESLSYEIPRLKETTSFDPLPLGLKILETVVVNKRLLLAITLIQKHPTILDYQCSDWLIRLLCQPILWDGSDNENANLFLKELAKHKLPLLTMVTSKRLAERLNKQLNICSATVLSKVRELGVIVDVVWSHLIKNGYVS